MCVCAWGEGSFNRNKPPKLQMELIDKKVKTTAIIIFLMIKSIEENINMFKEMKIQKRLN